MEMRKYEEALALLDEGIAKAKEAGAIDYAKLAKALQKKGNAYLKMQKFDEAIDMYSKALIENNDHGIKMSLQQAQKMKKEKEAKDYINPELAEQHREKGNELYKAGDFPGAIREYNEGLRRNPESVAILSNRCATYIKLMEFNTALKDADKCIELDPKFVKAYARKGSCHHMMKEYHKAMKAYEDGLKLDP
jgi:stress-induced-phosphoprotein 1